MTPERFKDSGNIHYSKDILAGSEYRTVDYSSLADAYKNIQITTEHMGINGVKYNDENPKGYLHYP